MTIRIITASSSNATKLPQLKRPYFKTQNFGAGYEMLPSLAAEEKLETVQRYRKALSEISGRLGISPGWIYSWTSTRDRHSSNVINNLELLNRLEKTLIENSNRDLEIVIEDPYFGQVFTQLARKLGVPIKLELSVRTTFVSRRLQLFKAALRNILSSLKRWFQILRAANRYPTTAFEMKSADCIIVSMFHNLPTNQPDGRLGDVYFGQLNELISAMGQQVVLCGHILGDPDQILKSIGKLNKPNITFGHLLNWTDIFFAGFSTIISFVKLLAGYPWSCSDRRVAKLVFSDLLNASGDILSSLLIEKAMTKLLRKIPTEKVLLMYENHPWEVAVIQATKKIAESTRIVGYTHCAILKSHLKHLTAKDEKDGRPTPHQIITTGATARDVYQSITDISPNRVLAGSNLSGPQLTEDTLRNSPPKKVKTILALFQGLPEMVGFLHFLAAAKEFVPNTRVVIRPHPIQFGLEKLIRESGIDIAQGALLEPCLHSKLSDSLSEADVVIYKGSTAAMYAIYNGIPVIYFDDDWLISDDPLIETHALKVSVDCPSEITQAIKEIENITIADYKNQHQSARMYVENYLAEPTSETTQAFLK